MPQNITTHVASLVEAAERAIETLPVDAALALHGRDEVVFVDLRDIRELDREGRVPGAFHCPRGMLEFWIDPQSKYHKAVFAADKRFVFFCAAGQRSALATETAQRMGLRPVAHIAGGFGAWKAAGGPVDTGTLKLVIGNKNYSSWSFRPWIAMKVAGIAFDEEVISLNAADFKERVGRLSGTGKVPALADGAVNVWESLAILEYLGEKFPQGRLWPADAAARAHARAVAAEMHAGFVPLRRHLPMNMWRPVMRRELPGEVQANVRRIEAMWTDCRTRFGAGGAFLFGAFGAADAMYAPVVSRFHTYAVEVGAAARAYMDAVMALPAWREWRTAALAEPWVLPEDEVDWPNVLRE
jgi:glutathione S-transferase